MHEIHTGDCAEVMASMGDNSVDAIITDPPYGLSFMGAKWDSFGGSTGRETVEERQRKSADYAEHHKGAPRYGNSHKHAPKEGEMFAFQEAMTPIFAEALRVAKPGAHLLCFGGTRTFHRMACAIEDAGWECRDTIMWVYGSGFPKSMDVAKAIDKASGYVGEVIGERTVDVGMQGGHMHAGRKQQQQQQQVRALSDQAKEWVGWGTCLKPAWEPIIVARKPLDGTVANNVLTWGVGAMNIDACRVPIEQGDDVFAKNPHTRSKGKDSGIYGTYREQQGNWSGDKGRFPANVVHDGSQMVLDLFPDTGRSSGGGMHTRGTAGAESTNAYGTYVGGTATKSVGMGDSGSAARFFYCAKASKKDRNYGCERLLTWAERDQELTQLLEQASSLLARDISESMMLNLVEQGCSTSLFGNENTVLSQEECRFITSTVIPLITVSKTCSSSHHSNTSESILDAIRTSEESGISLARLADKSSQSRRDSTSGGTDTATSAVSALFDVLSQIRGRARVGNFHCTVKPLALMEWLVKLVTIEGQTVLDPFCGSGTTLLACEALGRHGIGIEREPEYVEIIRRRLGDEA